MNQTPDPVPPSPSERDAADAAKGDVAASHAADPTPLPGQSPSGLVTRIISLVVLVLVIAGGYFYIQHREDQAPTVAAAPREMPPMPVRVQVMKRQDVPIYPRYLGQTESSQLVEIRARVSGHLESRSFLEGEAVKEGQVLFKIDPRPFQVTLAEAQAGLESAKATERRASAQLKRYQELAKSDSATQGELDDWQTQRDVAAAQVRQQEAAIAAAALQLEFTQITSPIAGRIGRALKEQGSYVDDGSNGLVAVVQRVDPLYVRFSVSEQDVLRKQTMVGEGRLRAPALNDTEVSITLSDGTTYAHKAKLNFEDVSVDQTTGTTVVRGVLPNPEERLKPGQFIHATVLGHDRIGVMRVPQSAVKQSATGASVLVVGANSTVESRPVRLGQWSDNDTWVIESGLEDGDRVIVNQLMILNPGMPVSVESTVEASSTTRPAK